MLFDIKPIDRQIYQDELIDFLPNEIIDIHTHCWNEQLPIPQDGKTVTWPMKVAAINPIEDLLQTYQLMFAGKKVTPLIFPTLPQDDAQHERFNDYLAGVTKNRGIPALIWSTPKWSPEELSGRIDRGGFLGVKSYLTMADDKISISQITIYDFFPPEQLEMLHDRGLIVMCHIPRSLRLKDPENLRQLVEIDRKYPRLKFIVAHVGRAYCDSDVGNAFEVLSGTNNLLFDFSANTNANVFTGLIETVGPKRILFGSDLPILRMRMKREIHTGQYVNVVPAGMYGDVSNDPNMREISGSPAEELTFFMYEELLAFKQAAHRTGLSKSEVAMIFFDNARQLLQKCGFEIT